MTQATSTRESDMIQINVAGKIRQYPIGIAEYREHVAAGGRTISHFEARQQARDFFKANADPALRAVSFWAVLDESGLVYRIEINRNGTDRILVAAPARGTQVRELYVA